MTQEEELLRSIVGEEIWNRYGYKPHVPLYHSKGDGASVSDHDKSIVMAIHNNACHVQFGLGVLSAGINRDNDQLKIDLGDPDLISRVRGKLRHVYIQILNSRLS
jgi:hypothetical protein